MISLRESSVQKVLSGITTVDEVNRAINADMEDQ